MIRNGSSGDLIFYFQCIWTPSASYSWSYSQRAFCRLLLLTEIITKFISKVITQVQLSQDQLGSRNMVHKSIRHSRVLCLSPTFLMFVVCRKKILVLTSLFLAYPSILECLTDLGKKPVFATHFSHHPTLSARFGPHAIRSGSRRQRDVRGYSLNWGNNPYTFGQKIIDCGDVSSNALLVAS